MMVAWAKATPPLPAELKTESNRLTGCLAKLWLACELRDGKCYFQADADSSIVRSMAVMLSALYSGASPAEILSDDASFLSRLGIAQLLTPNRRNSLGQVVERIRAFSQEQTVATKSLESSP